MRPLFIVDAFSARAFSGNPAAVCLLADDEPESWKQQMASEMNLAETAFVVRSDSEFSIRWFTPVCEVDLCGHATLASAHVLWQEGWVEKNAAITLQSRSGPLVCRKGEDEQIEMEFPLQQPVPAGALPNAGSMLGIQSEPIAVCQNSADYLIHIDSPEELRSLKPDFEALRMRPARGWIVTAQSDIADYDFISRYFAPAVGIDEDPVTGSAHCCLVAYWSPILNRNSLVGYQASKRGGVVKVEQRGDRAILAGHATTVVWGKCRAPRSGAQV